MGTPTTQAAPAKTEFQAVLRLTVVPVEPVGPSNDDEGALEHFAETAVDVLRNEAASLALGVVASIELDDRVVALEMTIEASSDSELHQKMGLILSTLESGIPLRLMESTASRASTRTDELALA